MEKIVKDSKLLKNIVGDFNSPGLLETILKEGTTLDARLIDFTNHEVIAIMKNAGDEIEKILNKKIDWDALSRTYINI